MTTRSTQISLPTLPDSKADHRDQLRDELEAFLKAGGQITEVESSSTPNPSSRRRVRLPYD